MVSRMLDVLRFSNNFSVPVTLDSAFKEDLLWWDYSLDYWNGISTLVFSSFRNKIALDASKKGWMDGSPGLGGYNYLANEYFKTPVPKECISWDICDLE